MQAATADFIVVIDLCKCDQIHTVNGEESFIGQFGVPAPELFRIDLQEASSTRWSIILLSESILHWNGLIDWQVWSHEDFWAPLKSPASCSNTPQFSDAKQYKPNRHDQA
jgi:hypothetical protein